VADIQAEWEDWQMDVMLQQLRQGGGAAVGMATRSGASLGGSRIRRGRGDADEDEPRRVSWLACVWCVAC
jgi:hypothetical protein